MDEEPREPINNVTTPSVYGLGTEIVRIFADSGLTFDIPELRGYPIIPPSFDE